MGQICGQFYIPFVKYAGAQSLVQKLPYTFDKRIALNSICSHYISGKFLCSMPVFFNLFWLTA